MLSLVPFVSHAQDSRPVAPPGYAPAEFNPDSAFAQTIRSIEGEPLALTDALEAALSGSPEVREAEAALAAARGTLMRERGAFDPELTAQALHVSNDLPGASPFAGASVVRTRETDVSAGAFWRLPIGTELGATLNAARLTTNSAFAALNPQYDALGQLTIRQPLLKGFGPAARVELSGVEQEFRAAAARRDDILLGVRSEIETAYWDLYAAERDLAVQILIRDQARALLSQAQLRAQAGLVGPNQTANARVFLAEQEQAVLDQRDRLDAASDQLASWTGRRPAAGQIRFRPTDEPPQTFEVQDADTLVARALRDNLELRAQQRIVEGLEARENGARWNALPALDLIGTLGGNALSGAGQDVIFGNDTLRTTIRGDFSDAFRQVRRRDYPAWSAGVQISIPLGLREGRGERNRARAEVARARERLESARRDLADLVRENQRLLTGGAERMAFAREGVAASFEQVRIGLLEYSSGRTTAFELVRLGADLAAAQRRYSEALVRTARASAVLRRLTGEGYPLLPATREGGN